MPNKSMQEIYDDAQQTYENTVVIPRWSPPDGPYAFVVNNVVERAVTGKGNYAGQEGAMIMVLGTILGGDYDGRKTVIARGFTIPGVLSDIKQLGGLLGSSNASLTEDVEAIRNSIGTVVEGEVERSTAKNGNVYANVRMSAVIETDSDASDTSDASDDD